MFMPLLHIRSVVLGWNKENEKEYFIRKLAEFAYLFFGINEPVGISAPDMVIFR